MANNTEEAQGPPPDSRLRRFRVQPLTRSTFIKRLRNPKSAIRD